MCNQCVRVWVFVYPQDGFKHKLLRNAFEHANPRKFCKLLVFPQNKIWINAIKLLKTFKSTRHPVKRWYSQSKQQEEKMKSEEDSINRLFFCPREHTAHKHSVLLSSDMLFASNVIIITYQFRLNVNTLEKWTREQHLIHNVLSLLRSMFALAPIYITEHVRTTSSDPNDALDAHLELFLIHIVRLQMVVIFLSRF